jgi:hypothetical protein
MKGYTKSYKLNRIKMKSFLPGFFMDAEEGEAAAAREAAAVEIAAAAEAAAAAFSAAILAILARLV